MPSISRSRPSTPIFVVLVAVLIVLAVGGILAAHNVATGSPQSTARPVLRWGNEGISDLYTLDPARGPDFNSRQAMQLVFGGLVRFGPNFSILPDIAERWRVSEHSLMYTFELRHDARFADGSKVTASDVVFSLNRTLSRTFAANSGAAFLTGIVGAGDVIAGRTTTARGIQVVRSSTVRISLTKPSGSFLAKLANPPGYVVPEHEVHADPLHWDQHAFGSGPFRVNRWVHHNGLSLIPNPYYYAGRPRLAGVYMPFIPEPLTAYKRYRAGAIDLMGIVHFPTEVLNDVQNRSDFHRAPRLETVYLTLNERRSPFNNVRVRLAFAEAIDKVAVVRAAYGNFARPTDTMMPPGLPGYSSTEHEAHFDPVRARTLLARAGYPGGRGLTQIIYPVDQDSQSVVLANALKSQWKRVLGVNVHLIQHSHSSYLDLLNRRAYDIGVIDWTADYPDPENFLSQQLRTGSPNNNGDWSSGEFDSLTDVADGLPWGNSTRLSLYRRAERIAMSQAATIPLTNPDSGILLREGVKGLTFVGGYVLPPNWAAVRENSGTSR